MSADPRHEWDWNCLPGFFGLPVAIDDVDGFGPDKPWLTWSTAAVVALVSLIGFWQGQDFIDTWGLIPLEAWRSHGITFITSFFLHGGFWHLVANLYFLVTFGSAIEEYAGSWRWLLIIVSATLLGGTLDVAIEAQSHLPLIGASGGISGLLVYYGLKLPRARLLFPIGLFFIVFDWYEISARWMLIIWVLLQVLGAVVQVQGHSHVASLAHLGGGLAGAIFWLIWKIWPFDTFEDDVG